jgi:hypothetical protein
VNNIVLLALATLAVDCGFIYVIEQQSEPAKSPRQEVTLRPCSEMPASDARGLCYPVHKPKPKGQSKTGKEEKR